ncbi:MAG: SDR family NAD(P)-dependent oxidoreductase, partial [Ferruginibacter sp.]
MKKLCFLFLILLNIAGGYAQQGTFNLGANSTGLFDSVYILPHSVGGTIESKKEVANNPGTGTLFRRAGRLDGPYALVAGGSKGIGYAIAEALARRGYNLILIARHADSLNSAKIKLESTYQVHVEVLVHDLAKEESAEAIAKWCTNQNIHLKMLCNVAGLGGTRDYLSFPLDSLRYMVRLNVESAMALTLTLLPLLEKNAPAYVLNVASMAGF